jgi:hypothetical protein
MNEKGTSEMSTRKEDAMMKMKGIGYWATTSIVALELLAGGVTDLVHGRTSLVAGQPVAEVNEVFDMHGKDFSFHQRGCIKNITWRFSQIFWRWVKTVRKIDEL